MGRDSQQIMGCIKKMQGDKFEAITINSEIPLSGQCFAEMPASSFVPSLFSL